MECPKKYYSLRPLLISYIYYSFILVVFFLSVQRIFLLLFCQAYMPPFYFHYTLSSHNSSAPGWNFTLSSSCKNCWFQFIFTFSFPSCWWERSTKQYGKCSNSWQQSAWWAQYCSNYWTLQRFGPQQSSWCRREVLRK